MKNPVGEVIDEYVAHEYPQEVDCEFRSWLTSESHSEEKERELSRLWAHTEGSTTRGFEESLGRIRCLTGISERRKVRGLRRRLRAWRVAAAIVAASMAGGAVMLPGLLNQEPGADILQAYIPKAELQTLTLPDGTVAMLNSNCTLLYPDRFTGSERCVYLSGEANFKVKADPEHPFIVKTADFQVTALGTEFNVAAYPDESEITATLIEGKVKVDCNNLTCSHTLAPNEQLVYNRNTRTATVNRADISDVTAWQRGETVMRSMTADEIFRRLGRRYPCTFVYNPSDLKSDLYTLTFAADASLPEVMDIIKRVMGDISYRMEGDRCYITSASRR